MFKKLPETCMNNANEFKYFENFTYSDLKIEILRAVKVKVMSGHLHDPKLKRVVMTWA